MSSSANESWGDRHRRLSERLATVPAVVKAGAGTSEEPATLAHALLDIERLCSEVSVDFRRVFDPDASDAVITESLLKLGEAFREFIYHVRDPQFYRYLPGCEHGNP